MSDANHRKMAEDLFRLVALTRLGLRISPAEFDNSKPRVSLSLENDGEYSGEVSIDTNAVYIHMRVWLIEVGQAVRASAKETHNLDKVHEKNLMPSNPQVEVRFLLSSYPVGCDWN